MWIVIICIGVMVVCIFGFVLIVGYVVVRVV